MLTLLEHSGNNERVTNESRDASINHGAEPDKALMHEETLSHSLSLSFFLPLYLSFSLSLFHSLPLPPLSLMEALKLFGQPPLPLALEERDGQDCKPSIKGHREKGKERRRVGMGTGAELAGRNN